MSGVIEKVKEVLHGHKDHSATGTTGTHTTGTNTTGHTGHSGVPEGTAGPHNSRIANAADPRVDSDLDSSRHTGAGGYNSGTTGAGYSGVGTTGTHGSTNAGPHDSNLMNKMDPRVDSDRDGSRNMGASGNTGAYSGTTGTTGNYGSTNAGPHDSNLMNKMDPRVDSDRDGSRNMGASGNSGYSGTHAGNNAGFSGTGTTGGISHSTNAGPHDSNLMNKADPRVDSDLDGRGNRHGAQTGGVFGASGSHATAGSGTAQNTAGPHNSDLLNKLDPRVDSDRDGSRTAGGNATNY